MELENRGAIGGMLKWLNRSSIAISYFHFLQYRDRFSLGLPLRTNHFRFLSNQAYILTCRAGRGSIEIYDFGDDVVHRASLQFPALQAGITVVRLNTYSGPLIAHPPKKRPFTSSPDSRLHHFYVQYNVGIEGYSFLVHNCTFLSYTCKESSSLADLSWEDWQHPYHRGDPLDEVAEVMVSPSNMSFAHVALDVSPVSAWSWTAMMSLAIGRLFASSTSMSEITYLTLMMSTPCMAKSSPHQQQFRTRTFSSLRFSRVCHSEAPGGHFSTTSSIVDS
jgi:hypothetical protein